MSNCSAIGRRPLKGVDPDGGRVLSRKAWTGDLQALLDVEWRGEGPP